jgi:hypothetical protein
MVGAGVDTHLDPRARTFHQLGAVRHIGSGTRSPSCPVMHRFVPPRDEKFLRNQVLRRRRSQSEIPARNRPGGKSCINISGLTRFSLNPLEEGVGWHRPIQILKALIGQSSGRKMSPDPRFSGPDLRTSNCGLPFSTDSG